MQTYKFEILHSTRGQVTVTIKAMSLEKAWMRLYVKHTPVHIVRWWQC